MSLVFEHRMFDPAPEIGLDFVESVVK